MKLQVLCLNVLGVSLLISLCIPGISYASDADGMFTSRDPADVSSHNSIAQLQTDIDRWKTFCNGSKEDPLGVVLSGDVSLESSHYNNAHEKASSDIQNVTGSDAERYKKALSIHREQALYNLRYAAKYPLFSLEQLHDIYSNIPFIHGRTVRWPRYQLTKDRLYTLAALRVVLRNQLRNSNDQYDYHKLQQVDRKFNALSANVEDTVSRKTPIDLVRQVQAVDVHKYRVTPHYPVNTIPEIHNILSKPW